MRLMEPFLDKGRNVTTDNFFTSLSLAHKLLSRKTTILGTVNKIRREIPQSARHTDRNEFTTHVFSTTAATLTAYAPKRKKTVYILSSMHSVIQTDNTTTAKHCHKVRRGCDGPDGAGVHCPHRKEKNNCFGHNPPRLFI
ncbi:uncharacterized protein LOC113636841 isoform X2 [Tachysurus fulvidraco]|nr:uncharacterized protein LOC113636841 isoform X2 [Tachysurus fulvidraco]